MSLPQRENDMYTRHDGRSAQSSRPFKITYNVFEHAAGSVLFEIGKTKVLCAVTLQSGVPPFLRGQGTGWLTAEYALLPTSTATRTNREGSMMRRHGRSIEISRLISRGLRTAIDFSALGERTIHVDCDVLHADAGTRTASITGSFAALVAAQNVWLETNVIDRPFLVHELAAISVGVLEAGPVLDPDYVEDSSGGADINFIITRNGDVVEIQGGGEKRPIAWNMFEESGVLARTGIRRIFEFLDTQSHYKPVFFVQSAVPLRTARKAPLFSLQNRQNISVE